MSADMITVKKPLVTREVGEFIESTRDDKLIDIIIHIELQQSERGTNSIETDEVANYINNCLREFVLAREFGYIEQ